MMKKIVAILVLILTIALLVGCGASAGGTVQKFFRAVDKGRIEDAMDCLSSSTLQTLGTEKWRTVLIEVSNQMADQGGLKSVNVTGENVTGDIGQVTVEITMGDGSEETERVDLIKEDGKWKIRLDPWSK